MKKVKISLIINIIIVVLVTLGSIFMLSGFEFMAKEIPLIATKLEALKYFTVESNILIGIISLIFIIFEIQILQNKRKEIPDFMYILKLIGTVGVTLTFIVTAIFLAPNSEYPYYAFYQNSNLFFHLIVPILSIITFIFFESTDKIKFIYTICGIIPMMIYGLFYLTNILIHLDNGQVSFDYDWYGFLRYGLNTIIIIFPIIMIMTYTISLSLWQSSKQIYKKQKM